MKKTLTVLMMVLMVAMLFVSCDNNAKEPEKEPEAKTYTVTFDLNGGTGDIKAQTVKDGEKAAKPEKNPANLKGVFKFWSLDGTTEYKFDTAITADTTIKAVWKTTFEIGDKGPAGGIIFYVNPNYEEESTDVTKNWKYLEAASADLASKYIFGYYRDDSCYSAGETATGIGTGKSNTAVLVEKMGDEAYKNKTGSDKAEYAAKACADYGNDTAYDDWFLPSTDEQKKMYDNKDKIGSFVDNLYWSSSEVDSGYVYYQNFGSGIQNGYERSNDYYVRPVRSF